MRARLAERQPRRPASSRPSAAPARRLEALGRASATSLARSRHDDADMVDGEAGLDFRCGVERRESSTGARWLVAWHASIISRRRCHRAASVEIPTRIESRAKARGGLGRVARTTWPSAARAGCGFDAPADVARQRAAGWKRTSRTARPAGSAGRPSAVREAPAAPGRGRRRSTPAVGCAAVPEIARSRSPDAAEIHHQHAIAEYRTNAEIVEMNSRRGRARASAPPAGSGIWRLIER